MGVGDTLVQLLEPLRAHPQRSGVLTDFDGTLAPIVDDPGSATALDGVADALGALAARYAVVAVLSGRPVAFLEPMLPPSIVVCGLYGLEVLDGGRRRDHPSAGVWRQVIDDVVAVSRAQGPAGMGVEGKGLSLTLHYRTRPDLEAPVRRWAQRQAGRSGLVVRDARMSVELHPPLAVDKGTTVGQVAAGLRAVCFVGDDVGDLSAFDALDALAADGAHAVRVAVGSDEAPPALLERADAVVDGPAGALEILRHLDQG